jgi:hypothetical protein
MKDDPKLPVGSYVPTVIERKLVCVTCDGFPRVGSRWRGKTEILVQRPLPLNAGRSATRARGLLCFYIFIVVRSSYIACVIVLR